MSKIFVKEGDTIKRRSFSGLIHDADYFPIDLRSAVKIESHVSKDGGEAELWELDVDVETAQFTTPPIDVSVAGTTYEFDLTIEWPNGNIETVPGVGTTRIEVVGESEVEAVGPRPSPSPIEFLRRHASDQAGLAHDDFEEAADIVELAWSDTSRRLSGRNQADAFRRHRKAHDGQHPTPRTLGEVLLKLEELLDRGAESDAIMALRWVLGDRDEPS